VPLLRIRRTKRANWPAELGGIRRIRAMMDLECPLVEVRADKGTELLDFSLCPIPDIGLDEFLKPAPCGLFHEHPFVAPG
jgi:hypothetical protein